MFDFRTTTRLAGALLIAFFWCGCDQDNTPSNTPESSTTSHSILEDIRRELPGHRIVFASFGETSQEGGSIWTMDVDGTNPLELTTGLGGDSQYPEWGPQANMVYFVSTAHGGTYEAYRVRADGQGSPERLTNFGQDVRNVAVSHDNQWISFAVMSANSFEGPESLAGYSTDLYVAPMDKVDDALSESTHLQLADLTAIRKDDQDQHLWHEQQEFAPPTYDDGGLPWLAYGLTENYDDDANTVEALWLVRADGSDARKVLEDESMPRWTSDGTRLVGFGFTVTDLESGTTKRLKIDDLNGDAGSVSLAPGGGFVLFEESDRNRRAALAREKYEGTSEENKYTILGERGAFEPRFSPVPVPTK